MFRVCGLQDLCIGLVLPHIHEQADSIHVMIMYSPACDPADRLLMGAGRTLLKGLAIGIKGFGSPQNGIALNYL